MVRDLRFGDVKLSWVVCDGRQVHVSAFANPTRGARPIVTCPECESVLRLRLGAERAWHAAHQSSHFCRLNAPETALHHNTKAYLAEQLASVQSIAILENCVGTDAGRAPGCIRSGAHLWPIYWNGVAVERRLNDRVPDIVLMLDGTPVAAVEVWVSHRVEPEKRHRYAEWKMPWIEVAATAAKFEPPAGWVPTEKLPIARIGPLEFVCAECARLAAGLADSRRIAELAEQATAARARTDAQAERAIRQRIDAERRDRVEKFAIGVQKHLDSRKLNGNAVERILLFDEFAPTGHCKRDALVIADVWNDGVKTDAFLGQLSDLNILCKVGHKPEGVDYLGLRDAGGVHLQEVRRRGHIVDEHSEWFRAATLLQNVDFCADWRQNGLDNRWPRAGLGTPNPLAGTGPTETVDDLDLLRHFFVRYCSGLPIRYRWTRDGRWFQPPVLREEVWRLFPARRTRP